MEYVQERITTLHDFGTGPPEAPVGRTAVVIPMTEREHATLAAERTLGHLEALEPGKVVVAIRASPEALPAFADWLGGFNLPLEPLWCSAPAVESLLTDADLPGAVGKGRDVWLALGVAAADHDYVVCHDADVASADPQNVARLLAPLADGFAFSKAYYARIEDRRLYGRLYRLFFAPLVRALADRHDAAVLDYLGSFRYPLAGEFGATASLVRELRIERRFGLEVGTLGDAFAHAGFGGTAQVDLGRYEHDHRAVGGPTGLADMSRDVGAALFRVLEDAGLEVDHGSLPEAYRGAAARLVEQYAADARFNGFEFDRAGELEQVGAYASAVVPPGGDDRLPRWVEAPVEPEGVVGASRSAIDAAGAGPVPGPKE